MISSSLQRFCFHGDAILELRWLISEILGRSGPMNATKCVLMWEKTQHLGEARPEPRSHCRHLCRLGLPDDPARATY